MHTIREGRYSFLLLRSFLLAREDKTMKKDTISSRQTLHFLLKPFREMLTQISIDAATGALVPLGVQDSLLT